jgi:hypothetical protein
MGGVTGFLDLDAQSPIGVELEGRWVELNQRANVTRRPTRLVRAITTSSAICRPVARAWLG